MAKEPTTTIIPLKVYRDQLVTQADLQAFKEDLLLSLARLIRENTLKPPKKWLKSHEVKSLLNISNGTLYSMRINGTLPYTKIGNIIYYDRGQVDAVLAGKKPGMDQGKAQSNATRSAKDFIKGSTR